MQTLALSQPDITDLEKRYVTSVLNSGRLALGPQLEAFESLMAETCGTRYAVAVSSGTAALHCIIRALEIGDGDEVITTPYSFIASANAALFERARPVFVDIEPDTFNIDPQRIESAVTEKTAAILAVDVFGCPARWEDLQSIADTHDLWLIDDGCEALGASVKTKPIGSWGDAAAFGFYPNKQITTGEGGCITTDSESLAELCRSLRNQGRSSRQDMNHVRLGFNYRLDEMSAAIGRAQLERLDDILAARERVADRYDAALQPLADDLHIPVEPPYGKRSWFVYVVRLADHFDRSARNTLIEKLAKQGISAAPYFPSIHQQPLYQDLFSIPPEALPISEATSARTLALPFYSSLPEDAPNHVAHTLRMILPTL